MAGNKFTGAGFVILSGDHSKLLSLVKKSGAFDIPKGHADPGETPFKTACRECYEECSIKINRENLFLKKPYNIDGLYVYVAKTNQTPRITPNPDTNDLEHVGHIWLTPEQFSKNSPKYLSIVIEKIFSDII